MSTYNVCGWFIYKYLQDKLVGATEKESLIAKDWQNSR